MADSLELLTGLQMAEVFSVHINNIDMEDLGLYGTITVFNGLTHEHVYNRERDDYESISSGERCTPLTLTGPSECIWADDGFTINLDLSKYDTLSPDSEFIRVVLEWFDFADFKKYDVLLTEKIDGKYGTTMNYAVFRNTMQANVEVTMNYAVFRDAFQVDVEVTLIDGNGKDPVNVYGLLAACGNQFQQEIILFQRKSDKCINVRPGTQIPLSRSAVVVSFQSASPSLTVRAGLYDYSSFSANDEIAMGSAEFKFKLQSPKTCTKNIIGKYGKIEVKATWRF